MSAPPIPLRVVSAAWPSPSEPTRARFLEELHRALGPRFRTEVVAPRVRDEDPVDEDRHGITVRRFRYPSRGRTVRDGGIGPWAAGRYVFSALRTARCRWEGSDSSAPVGGVVGHWIVPTGWVASRVAAHLGLPLVLYAHGSDVNVYGRRGAGRWMLRRALARASLVCAASEALADRLRAFAPLGTPIEVLPMGVSDSFTDSESDPSPPPPLRVLFVGDRWVSKGADVVATAVERASAEGLPVDLAWIGSSSGDTPSVGTDRGNLPPEEVAAAMADAHLLLLPSRAEGTPLVIQEAIATRLPWAATPVGGIPALAARYPGGTLLPPADRREELVTAIVDLIRRCVTSGAEGVRARRAAMTGDTDELRVGTRARRFGELLERALSVGGSR